MTLSYMQEIVAEDIQNSVLSLSLSNVCQSLRPLNS